MCAPTNASNLLPTSLKNDADALLPYCRRGFRRPPCRRADTRPAPIRPRGTLLVPRWRPYGRSRRMQSHNPLSFNGLYGLLRGNTPPTASAWQSLQGTQSIAPGQARLLHSSRLPFVQFESGQNGCQSRYSRILLHLPQDMGMETMARAHYPPHRG